MPARPDGREDWPAEGTAGQGHRWPDGGHLGKPRGTKEERRTVEEGWFPLGSHGYINAAAYREWDGVGWSSEQVQTVPRFTRCMASPPTAQMEK